LDPTILRLNLASPNSLCFCLCFGSRFELLVALGLRLESVLLRLFSDSLRLVAREVGVKESFLNKEKNETRDYAENDGANDVHFPSLNLRHEMQPVEDNRRVAAVGKRAMASLAAVSYMVIGAGENWRLSVLLANE
jgi:hypothetical protein